MTNNNAVVVGLVRGRHQMPVDDYIFESIEDVLDFKSLEKRVFEFLNERVGLTRSYQPGINQVDYTDVECRIGKRPLVVYVTGLTAATAAVISGCAYSGVSLTLMHYDASAGDYKAQEVLRF